MTLTDPAAREAQDRSATRRRYLMCPPTYFDVHYAINPWMDLSVPVDLARAAAQWEALKAVYESLGHDVEVIDAEPGLPDMVFAANGGLVVGGHALGARFHFPERQPEGPAYERWFAAAVDAGTLKDVRSPIAVNEGEGDFLAVGSLILAGYGFRTDLAAHVEAQELFGVPVVSLRLVDPRFYHLDTALAVLDDRTIAYYPGAFSEGSRAVLQRLFPHAVLASERDATAFGLNAVSDGRNVVLSAGATGMMDALRERGFTPIGVEMSEFVKAGGAAKCCTLELRS
jgi:N-dimethylarginine dimethylaminohydrolase